MALGGLTLIGLLVGALLWGGVAATTLAGIANSGWGLVVADLARAVHLDLRDDGVEVSGGVALSLLSDPFVGIAALTVEPSRPPNRS